MRYLVLVVLLLTVKSVVSLKLLPDMLQPDLEAIAKYFDNIDDTLPAYIHWPKEITFRVRLITDKKLEKYLQVDGTFTNSQLGFAATSFDGLYFKDDKFYVKNRSDGLMKEISNGASLSYSTQPHIITRGTSFLSIRYFGPDEIRSTAQSMYKKEKRYYDCALPSNPATFLLTPSGSSHFLECCFVSSLGSQTELTVDGGLRVLIGNKFMPQLRVEKARQASKILIDTNTFDVFIPEDSLHGRILHSGTFFFGVRMGSEGFLAEHRGHNVRMLGQDDVSGKNKNPEQHGTSGCRFSGKLREVEPRSSAIGSCLTLMPKFGKLQLSGHILEKHLNLNANKKMLDPECPFVIKFEDTVSYFLFGSKEDPVKEACSDNVRVWPKGKINPIKENFSITLVHPFAEK